MPIHARRMFLNGQMKTDDGEMILRTKICAMEVWVECFGGDPRYLKRSESREINGILSNLKGWHKNRATRRYGPYGTQRGYEKFD